MIPVAFCVQKCFTSCNPPIASACDHTGILGVPYTVRESIIIDNYRNVNFSLSPREIEREIESALMSPLDYANQLKLVDATETSFKLILQN